MNRRYRINEGIRVREVLVIGENGEQVGVMSLPEAVRFAREQSMDLVEVAPTAEPPVCRVLDYGRFKYDQAKKTRETKKTQRASVLREVRMRPKIGEHDIAFKTRQAKKLLDEGDKVKVSVFFRGREATHPEIAANLLVRVAKSLEGDARLERPPAMEGRSMSMILIPSPAKRTSDSQGEGQPSSAEA